MITTLAGDNSFALKAELKSLSDTFLNEYGELSVEQIDCSESTAASAIEALTGPPFLSPQKLVILRQIAVNKDLSQKLPDLADQIPPNNKIVVVLEQIDKRSSLYKFLKDQTDYKEFKALDPPQSIRWLVELAKSYEAAISSQDARYLVERVGLNQERLDNELRKLAIYNPSISKESIDLLTEPSPNSSIFDLLEAAFNGKRQQVINLYEQQRSASVEPQQIISMLTWQLHVLLLVSTAGDKTAETISSEAGMSPFVIRKSLIVAKRLSTERIAQLVSKLLKLDKDSKSKSIDLDDSLTHYLLSI